MLRWRGLLLRVRLGGEGCISYSREMDVQGSEDEDGMGGYDHQVVCSEFDHPV